MKTQWRVFDLEVEIFFEIQNVHVYGAGKKKSTERIYMKIGPKVFFSHVSLIAFAFYFSYFSEFGT